MLARDDLAEYIADNYGTCRAVKCRCLKHGWRGRDCPQWDPVAARNWDELKREQIRFNGKR